MFWKFNYVKAVKLVNEGKLSDALIQFDKMLDKKPKYYAMVQYAYFLIKAGEYEKAQTLYNNYIFKDISKKKAKDKLLCDINYALLVWKKGDLDYAIELTEDLLEKYKNTAIYVNLGLFKILKGDYENALKTNLEAYDFSPEHLGVLDNLGLNYYHLGEYDKAKEIYEKLFEIKENPSFADCYYNYGNVLLALSLKEEAKAMYEKALTSEFSVFSSVTMEQAEEAIKNLS